RGPPDRVARGSTGPARRSLPCRPAALELSRAMPWTPPPPPAGGDALNAHGPAAGGAEHLVSLDSDDIVGAAQASTGLTDFGGDSWRPHFEGLLGAVRTQPHP